MVQIVKIENRDEKIRIIEDCDEAFPIRLFDRSDCDEIIYRMTTYALFYAAYDVIRGGYYPVGYVAFYANNVEKRTAYISNIGVSIHYQRNHIGSRLMQKSIEESRKRGMEVMRLEVLKTNAKAISFYKHWGFTVEAKGDKDTYYMRKYL